MNKKVVNFDSLESNQSQIIKIDQKIDQLTTNQLSKYKSLLYQKKILLFQKNFIADEALISFSKAFGRAVPFIDKDFLHPVHQEISISSNAEQGYKEATGSKVEYWHSDSSFLETPLSITLLYGKHTPKKGGGTEFVNMIDLWRCLPQSIKKKSKVNTLSMMVRLCKQLYPSMLDLPCRR